MNFDAVLIEPRREAMEASGLWLGKTLLDYLDQAVKASPDKVAVAALRAETDELTTLTYAELDQLSKRAAVGLTKLGIGRGDIVGLQMPNWWEFTVVYMACIRIGAVLNPMMHIFRQRELRFMLNHGETKVVIVPKLFRGFDHEAMLDELKDELPHLEHIVTAGDDGTSDRSLQRLLLDPSFDADTTSDEFHQLRSAPNEVMQLIYTSGTTGEPKGAMHTANTTISNIDKYSAQLGLSADDVIMMASPMAHQTGFMYGLMMPIFLGATAVLLDVWEPNKAEQLIADHGCTFTMASTPFLMDLTAAIETSDIDTSSLKVFLCAGAPIPGPVVERANEVTSFKVVSAWGMSENGVVTMTDVDDPPERSINSDGKAIPGMEVRVVDEAGNVQALGQEGRFQVRGCSNFGGYLKRPQLNGMDDDGWFETGDLARMDEAGYIRISGRSKDIIIRGGENVPVVEIESLLYRHPAIATAAIVGYPDDRLGERACAYVTLNPDYDNGGEGFSFTDMVDYLTTEQVAKQYLPERLEVVAEMPTTASGKIQKFKLRDQLVEQLQT